MFELSKKLKLNIIEVLLSENELFGYPQDSNNIVKFLDKLLNLKSLPSEDTRFDNAYNDALKHLVMNDDWEYNYVLTERFNIVDDNNIFIQFLNKIVNPELRKDEDEIIKYLLILNPYLEKEGLVFDLKSYNEEGISIYEVSNFDESNNLSSSIIKNIIPFFVDNEPQGRADRFNSHLIPTEFPSFVISHNSGWNDYDIFSEYHLYYYENLEIKTYIGEVKIIKKNYNNTADIINKKFFKLDQDFCSLGQKFEYYYNLKNILGKDFDVVLWALRDTAFFSNILEEFENNKLFVNSLIRFDEQERLLREVKYRIYDYNLEDLYSFKYSFKPNYSTDPVEIEFDFNNDNLIPRRIIALIGKNGTGKTQLITTLPLDISKKKNANFTPTAPLFSKVIAVSYSVFDNFEIPKKTVAFNYIYCGLRDTNGDKYEEKGLKRRFHNSLKKIKSNGRFNNWIKLFPFFLDQQLIDEFIITIEGSLELTLDVKGFNSVYKKLSSGQSILLFIITEIVANIRFDSIVLYDEPETHLHPNAISQLINIIYELTNEFQSYCIIATHSPLIVRELLSQNVFIIERDHNIVSIRKPINETFGENLTVITEDIFGNSEIPKQYKTILQKLVNTGKSYDDIIDMIESDNIPLSLNTRIYLKSIINEKS